MKSSSLLVVIVSLACLAACQSSPPAGSTPNFEMDPVTTGKVRVQTGPEIDIWKEAVRNETYALVRNGHADLDEVKVRVSSNTFELEQKARQAHISNYSQIFRISHEIALQQMGQDTPRLSDEYFEAFLAEQKEQFNDRFTREKNLLIEQHFNSAIASQ